MNQKPLWTVARQKAYLNANGFSDVKRVSPPNWYHNYTATDESGERVKIKMEMRRLTDSVNVEEFPIRKDIYKDGLRIMSDYDAWHLNYHLRPDLYLSGIQDKQGNLVRMVFVKVDGFVYFDKTFGGGANSQGRLDGLRIAQDDIATRDAAVWYYSIPAIREAHKLPDPLPDQPVDWLEVIGDIEGVE